MDNLRISKKNTVDEIDVPEAPNPRLMQALAKQYKTFNDLKPVDPLNSKTVDTNLLPELDDPSRKKRTLLVERERGKAYAVSFYLRSAFAALEEVHCQRQQSQLSFIVVNFDHAQSDLIVSGNASQAGATFYKSKLVDRFKRGLPKRELFLIDQPHFIVTLEDSVDGSLHANILMQHHPDDERTIREMLKVEAKQHKNAVELQTEYKLWLDAAPGSERWELNELERDDYPDLCSYPLIGPNKQGLNRFYRMTPIDAGAADYMSKELNKPLQGLSGASRLAMDGKTKARANKIYKERFNATLNPIAAAMSEAENLPQHSTSTPDVMQQEKSVQAVAESLCSDEEREGQCEPSSDRGGYAPRFNVRQGEIDELKRKMHEAEEARNRAGQESKELARDIARMLKE